MEQEKQYILKSDEKAIKRLSLQHELFESSSQNLILSAGVEEGQSVLEIGCGIGLMTEWLCQSVGSNGKLTAIDINSSFIAQTQKKMEGYQNCNIQIMDVDDIDELNEKFDLIYCRMVLHHLQKPEIALQKLVDVLKPQGRLVCEEPPCMEKIFAYPPSPALEQFKELVVKTFQANNTDYKIAYTMSSVMQQAGLTIKIEQSFQPLLSQDYRKLHLMGLRDISAKMLEYQLINETDLENLATNLEQELATAKSVALFNLFQVVGVKN